MLKKKKLLKNKMKISKTNYSNSCQGFFVVCFAFRFSYFKSRGYVHEYRHPQGQRCKISLELKLQIVVNFVTCVLPQLQKTEQKH